MHRSLFKLNEAENRYNAYLKLCSKATEHCSILYLHHNIVKLYNKIARYSWGSYNQRFRLK